MEKQYTAMPVSHCSAVREKVLTWGRRKIQPPVLTCSEKIKAHRYLVAEWSISNDS